MAVPTKRRSRPGTLTLPTTTGTTASSSAATPTTENSPTDSVFSACSSTALLTNKVDAIVTATAVPAPHLGGNDGDNDDNDGVARVVATGLSRGPPPSVAAMSPEERAAAEKRLVARVDRRLMPMLVIMYILNYIDRNNIAAAKLAGLPEDLNLDPNSTQYQTAVSILFAGYLTMQIPSNVLLSKTGSPGIYLPACMLVWGNIAAVTATCNSYAGLLASRFFLGVVEAAFFPGALYYLSSWYTPRELGFRTAILSSGSLVSGAFSGVLSAAVAGWMEGLLGLRAWRWLFVVEGGATIAAAAVALWTLPNLPATTSWLSPGERDLAAWRLDEALGAGGDAGRPAGGIWRGLGMAIRDKKTWLLTLTLLATVSSCAVTHFLPSLVKTLGFPTSQTLLLTTPPYAVAVLTTFANAYYSDRRGRRYAHVSLPLLFATGTFVLAAAATGRAVRYAAMVLMVPAVYTSYVVTLSWISNCIPVPAEKRAAGIALINCLSNLSQVWASYLYPDRAAPRYALAMAVNAATTLVALLAATVLRAVLVRANRDLDRAEGLTDEGTENSGRRRGFRYRV